MNSLLYELNLQLEKVIHLLKERIYIILNQDISRHVLIKGVPTFTSSGGKGTRNSGFGYPQYRGEMV